MKILFLDIDGVLNSREFNKRIGDCTSVSPKLIEKINRVIRETECKIVVSSTWRLYHNKIELYAFLSSYGFNGEIIGYTPDLKGEKGRGQEINQWLSQNPQVTAFAIVDDDSFDISSDKLVKTSFDVGITDENANKLIEILNQ